MQLTIERLRIYAGQKKSGPPYIGIPQSGKPPLILSRVHLRAALAANTLHAELKKTGVCDKDDRFPLELNGGRAVYRLPIYQNGRSYYRGLDVRTWNAKWVEKQRKRLAAAPKPKGKHAIYIAKLEKELTKKFPHGRPQHPAFLIGKPPGNTEREMELAWYRGKANRKRVVCLISKALAVEGDLIDRHEDLKKLWAAINPEAEVYNWYSPHTKKEWFMSAYRALWGPEKPQCWAFSRSKHAERFGEAQQGERICWAERLRDYDARKIAILEA